MKLTLKIWRQPSQNVKGKFETYSLDNVSEHMSFLEMLDVLNEKLSFEQKIPIAFEHDCREGIMVHYKALPPVSYTCVTLKTGKP
jgi:succinate dehydrogenase / fumarate reductase iron-sulfur subunit